MSWNCLANKRSSKLRLDAKEKVVIREIKALIQEDKISIEVLLDAKARWWVSTHVIRDYVPVEHYNNLPLKSKSFCFFS